MNIHLNRWQQALLTVTGSLLVAVLVARMQNPAFLQARLLANMGQGPQCFKSADSGDLIFDDHALAAPWSPTDGALCSGMQMGDLKHPDGSVLHWGQWDAARIGGSSYGGGGSFPSGEGSGTETRQMNSTGESANQPVDRPTDHPNDNPTSSNGDMHPSADDQNRSGSQGQGQGQQSQGGDEQPLRDAERSLKQSRRDLENRRRELKGNFRNSKVDISSLENSLSEWEKVLGQLETYFNNKDAQGFWDVQQDQEQNARRTVDESFQQLYQGQQTENNKRMVEQKKRNLRDFERDMKDHVRQKNDVTQLQDLYQKNQDCISQMEQKANDSSADPQDLNDLNFDCDQVNRDYWDESQVIREGANEQRNEADVGRVLKDKERMLKQFSRECEKGQCKDDDRAALEKIKGTYDQIRQAHDQKDFQGAWDANQESDVLMQDFGQKHEEDRKAEDMGRWLKEAERHMQYLPKMLDEVRRQGGDPERLSKVMAVAETMKKHLQEAKDAYQAGDFEGARFHLEELNTTRQDLDDVMQSFNEDREQMNFGRELEFMHQEIVRAEALIKKFLLAGRIDQKKADLCLGYVGQARTFMDKMTAAYKAEDWPTLENAKESMDEMGNQAEQDCSDLFNEDHGKVESFKQTYVDEPNQAMAQRIIEKVSKEVTARVLENLKQNSYAFNDLVNKSGQKYGDQITQTIQALGSGVVPEEYQDDYLAQKTAILSQIQELEDLRVKLQETKKLAMAELEDLKAIQDQVAGYNWVGTAGADMQQKMQEFLSQSQNLSKDQVKQKVEVLKREAEQKMGEARQEKFAKGIIPFADSDDNQWFTPYAAQAKLEGLVKGTGESGGKELNPSGNTNVAEAIALFGRVVGIGEDVEPNSPVGRALPEWAKAAAGTLEQRGVNLTEIFKGQKAGDAVTRGQVARLLKAVFELSAEGSSDFADLPQASSAEAEAISAVSAAEVMTGYDDGSRRFGVHDALNRAALMKLLIKAKEQGNH